jgi:hypothetical protein
VLDGGAQKTVEAPTLPQFCGTCVRVHRRFATHHTPAHHTRTPSTLRYIITSEHLNSAKHVTFVQRWHHHDDFAELYRERNGVTLVLLLSELGEAS